MLKCDFKEDFQKIEMHAPFYTNMFNRCMKQN